MPKTSPMQPESPVLASDRHNRGFPPNPENPSRVEVGEPGGNEVRDFPAEAVERLGKDLASRHLATKNGGHWGDLGDVLAWIARYVPRLARFGERIVVDGGVSILILDGEEPFDGVELIRINGRVFAPEVPAVAGDDDDFLRELRGVLADCSEFLSDIDGQLSDRCEAMLAQVVADEGFTVLQGKRASFTSIDDPHAPDELLLTPEMAITTHEEGRPAQ
jgi:hypothetical protein